MSDWKKDKAEAGGGGREHGKPHPDAKHNFKQWKNIYSGNDFRRKLAELKANVYEFFLFNNSQVNYHIFKPEYIGADGERYPPLDDQGIPAPTPSNPNHRKMPDWYEMADPLCIQVSFLSNAIKHGATVNFNNSNRDFKQEMTYYLKIDWDHYDRQMYNV